MNGFDQELNITEQRDNRTTLEMALDQAKLKQDEYAEEETEARKPEDHKAPLRQLMSMVGRSGNQTEERYQRVTLSQMRKKRK